MEKWLICSISQMALAEELFSLDLSNSVECLHKLGQDLIKMNKAIINIDNSFSPSQTLLQINCTDHKGVFYDILRTLKDCNIQIAYGLFLSNTKGCREVDVFVHQNDGKKIMDPENQDSLCSRLRAEMFHPLRAMVVNRGPDIDLLVSNPVELCGKGRPCVFYDVTLALKTLGICVFSVGKTPRDFYLFSAILLQIELVELQAEIGRHCAQERQWEVSRFLLEETSEFPFVKKGARSQVADTVRITLMGL